MTLGSFIADVSQRLSVHYAPQECKVMAVRMLKECIEGYKGYEHLVSPDTPLNEFTLAGHLSGREENLPSFLEGCAGRLSQGEPLQYVLGYEWFCGHRFNVAPGVLVPRPETEELVQLAARTLQRCTNARVLDICSGSGCITWSVAAAFPKSKVYGCDISPAALEISKGQKIESDDAADTLAAAEFFECDILSDDAGSVIEKACGEGKFNVIVSNPPYVCEEEKPLMHRNVLEYEPSLALFVPDSNPLLFYRRIAELAVGLLCGGGTLLFEINERFGAETLLMLQDLGYADCKVVQDLFGKDRMVSAVLP